MDLDPAPLYQHRGFGTEVIKDVIKNKLNLKFNKIMVGIDCKNTNSLKLFEKLGLR
ncbi:MAG: GNAT family N-acetyltransferase [Bacilli bacterium]